MKKYRKLACILAGSMTMSLFAGCIGNGDVVPEEKNESTDTEEQAATEASQEIKKADSRDIDQVHLRDKDVTVQAVVTAEIFDMILQGHMGHCLKLARRTLMQFLRDVGISRRVTDRLIFLRVEAF